MQSRSAGPALWLVVALAAPVARAHDADAPHAHEATATVPLEFVTETAGPVAPPPAAPLAAGTAVTGQGFWRFVAARDKVPVPEEALPKLKGAHGTLIVDPASDTVYWGLQGVGWIAFTEGLTKSAVVAQDAVFKSGNLHGADILPRPGARPLVAVADNVQGRVYLSDTSFESPKVLGIPTLEPYADGKGYAPTDVAFAGGERLWVTDGYGKAWFMPAAVEPLAFEGHAFGGKSFSGTPHGITYDPKTNSLLVSARPEGLIKTWDAGERKVRMVDGLPKGSTVCDTDLWGDYALAPCLDGPDKSPGPIAVVNLKKRAVVATLKPKADLGYEDAQHIHDACWYVTGEGDTRQVYVIYTNWNPGGVGALRLVNVAE
ncbi:MAG: hypothetical protein ACKOSQ_01525 [Planctomycetaceae bacterium]